MKLRPAIVVFPALFLAACQAEPASEATGPTAGLAEPVVTMPTQPASRPAPIDIGILRSEHVETANLSGELGCSFMTALGGEALWIGMGDVLPDAGAQGVILIDGKPVKLAMSGTGGFDAMAKGARFSGGDLEIAFDRTAEEPLQEEPGIAMESTAFTTTMTVIRGRQQVAIQGVLECGP